MQATGTFRSTTASSRFFQLCARVLRPVPRRHAATYRRSRSKLNIKPDPSFLPSKTEPHDHIIFNPPPSMPNIYHTPTIFLPAKDKRRPVRAALQAQQQASQSAELAPTLREPYEKRYHLTEEQVNEIRRLRAENPDKWTNTILAKKFDCSKVFVSIVIRGLANGKRDQQKMVHQVLKSNWGIKRRVAREDRQIRKEKWTRDA